MHSKTEDSKCFTCDKAYTDDCERDKCWKDNYSKYIPEVKEPIKEFKEIIVSYPNPDICTYPEYKGKPYFEIKYIKNGEECIGYGTYNPHVLSEYIREFINSK